MRIQGFTSYLGAWQAAPGPLYRRLAAAIAAAVASGRRPAGWRLRAERPLAAALAVSRTTVIGAYDVLREEGWVESRRGSGTRVRALPPELPAEGAALPADAAMGGGAAAAGGGASAATPSLAAAGGLGGLRGPGGPEGAGTGETTRPLRRMAFFRGLVETSGSRIHFLGAHLPAVQPVLPQVLAAAAPRPAAHLGHHPHPPPGRPALLYTHP